MNFTRKSLVVRILELLQRTIKPNVKTYKSRPVCLCHYISTLPKKEQIAILKYLKRKL